MEHPSQVTIDEALNALKQLPEAAQTVIAAEIMERIGEFSSTQLSNDQSAEIKRRLAAPRRLVDDSEMRAFFARYGAGP